MLRVCHLVHDGNFRTSEQHGGVRVLMVETRTQHRSGRMAHATRTASDANKSKKVLVEYTTIVGSMVLSNSKDVSSFHHSD